MCNISKDNVSYFLFFTTSYNDSDENHSCDDVSLDQGKSICNVVCKNFKRMKSVRTKIRMLKIGKRKLPSVVTNSEEVSSSKDSDEASCQGNPCQKTIEVNTEESVTDDVTMTNQNTNDNDMS